MHPWALLLHLIRVFHCPGVLGSAGRLGRSRCSRELPVIGGGGGGSGCAVCEVVVVGQVGVGSDGTALAVGSAGVDDDVGHCGPLAAGALGAAEVGHCGPDDDAVGAAGEVGQLGAGAAPCGVVNRAASTAVVLEILPVAGRLVRSVVADAGTLVR
jgi:hypothetical protein